MLTDEEEGRIADWAMHMAKIGYGRTRKELCQVVKKILDDDGRVTPFKDNVPGKDWLKGFFSRHPQLSLRTTLQLGKERAIISPEKIKNWFADLISYIEEEVKDPGLLKDPSRLYNADESGFSFCCNTGKVVGYKGAPVVYNYGNSSKQQLTVLACGSAVGHFCPPMIVYPGQRFNYEPLEGFEDAHMGRSETGWMDSELFCHWLLTCFIPSIESRCVKKPVLLLLDGHSTHLSLEASNICVANGIELYCLLEHSSHVMQPLDLRLFSVLKQNWKESVRAFQVANIGDFVTKRTFARVFKSAWEKSATIDVGIKGFMEAGLFPICADRVMQSVKLEPSRVFQSPSVAAAAKTASSPSSCAQKQRAAEETDAQSDASELTTRTATLEVASSSLPCSPVQQSDTQVDAPEPTTPADALQEASSSSLPCAPVSPTVSQSNASGTTTATVMTETVSIPSGPSGDNDPPTKKTPESPFSKHLKYPEVQASQSKKRKMAPLPKAITGQAYRQLMLEKKALKEQQEKEKIKRKEERIQKKAMKDEQLRIKKIAQLERKRAMQEKKRKAAEKAVQEATASDSDDSQVPVVVGNCYKCEQPYENEYMVCDKCFRKFHVNCVQDDIIEGIPFECKYC